MCHRFCLRLHPSLLLQESQLVGRATVSARREAIPIGVEGGGAYDERGARGRRDASCEDAAGCAEHLCLLVTRRWRPTA